MFDGKSGWIMDCDSFILKRNRVHPTSLLSKPSLCVDHLPKLFFSCELPISPSFSNSSERHWEIPICNTSKVAKTTAKKVAVYVDDEAWSRFKEVVLRNMARQE
jgi:hypothetical protein